VGQKIKQDHFSGSCLALVLFFSEGDELFVESALGTSNSILLHLVWVRDKKICGMWGCNGELNFCPFVCCFFVWTRKYFLMPVSLHFVSN
jgi:hypothetical protein